MADMLVKLYNMPHSRDIEENLFRNGIKIKIALVPDRSRIIDFSRTCVKGDYSDEVQAAFSNNPVTPQQGKRKSSVSHVMRRQPKIFSALWLCWKVKEKRE